MSHSPSKTAPPLRQVVKLPAKHADLTCLLPTRETAGHGHVIFTIPSELRPLWEWNKRLMADLLFEVVMATLFKFLDDPKHLGARPGVLAALHTWGRTLVLHPHT